ncbi:MAG: response regulator [Deltaproteobacteria bacterium]|nr:response regulator [Deltaproteobacteria bacterium]
MIRPDPKERSRPGASARAARVLLAEDDDEMRTLLKAYLELAGYEVRAVGDGLAVMEALTDAEWAADVLVTDLHMPVMGGMELLRRLGESGAAPPTIVITSFGDDAIHNRARKLGAIEVFDKPFDSTRLVRAVKTLLDAG